MIEIISANESDKKLWETVLSQCQHDGHFFDWKWRGIISQVFGHKAYYLILLEDKIPKAICPLFLVKSFLFGSSLISVPYLNGGGILSIDEQFVAPLVDYIKVLQKKLSCNYSELRYREAKNGPISELPLRSHKAAMKLKLYNDPEKLFASFPPKLRSQIRRPGKEGCTVKSVTGKEIQTQHISEFFKVFSETMRDLGTPVYSKKLFKETLKAFGEHATLGIVYHNTQPVASGITIRANNIIEIPWAASLRRANKFSPNMLLYWELLKSSCLNGAEFFDFGRSTIDSGTYKFKAQWGSKPQTLHWYYIENIGQIPDINPRSKKFELLVSIWQKLPISIANMMGPIITKSLP